MSKVHQATKVWRFWNKASDKNNLTFLKVVGGIGGGSWVSMHGPTAVACRSRFGLVLHCCPFGPLSRPGRHPPVSQLSGTDCLLEQVTSQWPEITSPLSRAVMMSFSLAAKQDVGSWDSFGSSWSDNCLRFCYKVQLLIILLNRSHILFGFFPLQSS